MSAATEPKATEPNERVHFVHAAPEKQNIASNRTIFCVCILIMDKALKKIEDFRAKYDALKVAHAQLVKENADLARQIRALQKATAKGKRPVTTAVAQESSPSQ